MHDQVRQLWIAQQGALNKAQHQKKRRREEIARRFMATLEERGIKPEEYCFGLDEVAAILGRPTSTVRRWVRENRWGLGEASHRVGWLTAVRTDVVVAARDSLNAQRPRPAPDRIDPSPPIGSSPSKAILEAVAAAPEGEPVTLHQVAISCGLTFEMAELAPAAIGLVQRRALIRTRVPRVADVGPAQVYAYSKGPGFEDAKSRNPTVIKRLRKHPSARLWQRIHDLEQENEHLRRTLLRTTANTPQSRMEQGAPVS